MDITYFIHWTNQMECLSVLACACANFQHQARGGLKKF